MSGKFDLSVNFSLHNGAVVLSSEENLVKIGLTEIHNKDLKKKLQKSVASYFALQGKSPESEGICEFVSIDESKLRHEISLRYGESKRENERKNEGSEAAMLLDTLFTEAGKAGATDIHIEEKRVRFRISSSLETVCELSLEKSRELIRRIKILSNLNVLECRRGQDGQFVFSGEDEIFVRVSTIPSISPSGPAESVVLRLLNITRVPLSLGELGFSEKQCADLRSLLKKEQGLCLICGATGSGKSTTAASLLTELEKIYGERKKIITIEDPPEYVLDGMTQIHVDENTGMSFFDALRFVFRQDPDVIFIGEIRDSVTARTVLQASLTGHLVFATVHTSGLEETAARMRELGVDFSELSSVLQLLVFQKLVPGTENKVCLKAEILTADDFKKNEKEKMTYEKLPLRRKTAAFHVHRKAI
ncbi:MAG: Flp pilus assembly complex ATPase component TadA [Treponema sp.]|nr:Flp pilus assembly complex ATPase component TadA [Treponema sp.]